MSEQLHPSTGPGAAGSAAAGSPTDIIEVERPGTGRVAIQRKQFGQYTSRGYTLASEPAKYGKPFAEPKPAPRVEAADDAEPAPYRSPFHGQGPGGSAEAKSLYPDDRAEDATDATEDATDATEDDDAEG